MIISLRSLIDEEMLEVIINAYNNLPKDDTLTIYMKSTGGSVGIAEVMLDIINSNASKTTLIAYDNIYSSAFKLFFEAKCLRILKPQCLGMFHQSTIPIVMNEQFKATFQEEKQYQKLLRDYSFPETLRICELLEFTPKEIQAIKQDKDLYFLPNRMQQFLELSIKKQIPLYSGTVKIVDFKIKAQKLIESVATCPNCSRGLPCNNPQH